MQCSPLTRRGISCVVLAAVLLVPGVAAQGNGDQQGHDPVDDMESWEDLLLPPGVEGEVVAEGLMFPTSIDWDENDVLHVGLVGFSPDQRQILRVLDDGSTEPLDLTGANMTTQILDITFHEGKLYWSTTGRIHVKDMANATQDQDGTQNGTQTGTQNGTQDGTQNGTQNGTQDQNGTARTIVQDLPAWGDHRTDEIVFGPDGRLYVGQGTVTNSGVVGFDQLDQPNAINNVSGERPSYRDVPCEDVTLSGHNWETTHPFNVATDLNSEEGAGTDTRLVHYATEDEARQAIDDARQADGNATNGTSDGNQTNGNQTSDEGQADDDDRAGGAQPGQGGEPDDRATGSGGADIPQDRPDDLWLLWPEAEGERVVTGPFSPFATPTYEGQVITGEDKCSGAVLSMEPDGSDLRPVAWGFRNPFGLKFADDGRLWVSDNGPDKRGSRPLGPGPDTIQVVELGGDTLPWYGWPDHTMGLPYTDPFFSPPWGPEVEPVFAEPPSEPITQFTFSGAHASANKFDFGRANSTYDGSLFVAEFGGLGIHPPIGANAGMSVNRVDMETGRVTEFIIGQDRWSGDFRPVEAAFGPDDRLYVVDFGPATQEPGDGNNTHGARYEQSFTPAAGRILAFTLPDEMDWEGRPAGNPGGEGQKTSGGEMGETSGDATVVQVFDYGFGSPGEVRVGDTVAFENQGEVGHTATEYQGTFNSGFALAPGTTFTWTPDEPGTYRFYCGVHPSMQGVIEVLEQAQGDRTAREDRTPGTGTGGGPGEDGEDEDTPLGVSVLLLAMLGGLFIMRRR